MKNYEKYADEIREYGVEKLCDEFIIPHILKKDSCVGIPCRTCSMLQMLWLLEDYKEPEVDWSKVEVDTPILVRHSEYGEWFKRHFAGYGNGKVYAWTDGCTSWSTGDVDDMTEWRYAKLAESGEE